MIVSNIGITPDLSAIYTSNSGMHTAFIQVSLKEDHKTGSFVYMQRLRERFANDFPEVSTYFQTGWPGRFGRQPGPARPNRHSHRRQRSRPGPLRLLKMWPRKLKALELRQRCADTAGSRLSRARTEYRSRARSAAGHLAASRSINDVITALTSDTMIAPSFWVDPKTGNNYLLTVQYPENQIKTLTDFKQIPLRPPEPQTQHRLNLWRPLARSTPRPRSITTNSAAASIST